MVEILWRFEGKSQDFLRENIHKRDITNFVKIFCKLKKKDDRNQCERSRETVIIKPSS